MRQIIAIADRIYDDFASTNAWIIPPQVQDQIKVFEKYNKYQICLASFLL